jgi:hypothetical protein
MLTFETTSIQGVAGIIEKLTVRLASPPRTELGMGDTD